MIKINLAPQAVLHKQKQGQHMLQAGAAGVCVLLVFGMVSVRHLRRASSLESHLAERQAFHKGLQPRVQEVGRLEGEINTLKAKLDAIEQLLHGRLTYPHFMQALLRSMPGGVWVSSIQTTLGGPDAVSFTASAAALASEDIADWVATFEESAEFSNVRLGAIQLRAVAGQEQFSFQVQGSYAGEAAQKK